MSTNFDLTHRPGLAYQHAFDSLATHLAGTSGPVACLSAGTFQAVELLRRTPQVHLIDTSDHTQEIGDRLGVQTEHTAELDTPTFAAIAWVEPQAAHASHWAQIRDWLRPGGRLYLVTGGPFARFLQERRQSDVASFVNEIAARRALRVHGFRLRNRLGIHGLRAIFWYLLSAAAGRLGRRAWQDRLHYAMRRDFITLRGPAALVLLTAEVAS